MIGKILKAIRRPGPTPEELELRARAEVAVSAVLRSFGATVPAKPGDRDFVARVTLAVMREFATAESADITSMSDEEMLTFGLPGLIVADYLSEVLAERVGANRVEFSILLLEKQRSPKEVGSLTHDILDRYKNLEPNGAVIAELWTSVDCFFGNPTEATFSDFCAKAKRLTDASKPD